MYRGKIKTEVTDEKLDYDKVIEDLVTLFENCSDRGTISTICASKDWHDRIDFARCNQEKHIEIFPW